MSRLSNARRVILRSWYDALLRTHPDKLFLYEEVSLYVKPLHNCHRRIILRRHFLAHREDQGETNA